ncbi:MAG TPA: hypothetical protein VGL54_01175 [Solirubrobacteraceae bacterium]|jgi:hypothetical protein
MRIALDAVRSRPIGRLLLVFLAVALVGCGSAAATHETASDSSAAVSAPSASRADSAAAAPTTSPVSATTPPSASCATAVAATLGTVAARVYHEAATGGDVAQAVHRVQSSTALADAIDGGDAAAARAALRALLLDQIARVEILRGGRVFAQAGSGAAIAPVHGSIPGTSAKYILSTQPVHAYLQVVHQVTGAQLLLLGGAPAGAAPSRPLAGTIPGSLPAGAPAAGPLTLAGRSYQTFTLAGAVYPSGPLRIVLLVPSSSISCPGALAQARVETLGHVGERIYQEELHSPDVAATLRSMESSTVFQRAVAAGSVAATRAAILGFFAAHIHVVRVRVTIGGRLLIDEGGPYALAPVHGTLRSGGRVVGDFEMAIQDDAGYLKLARLFTGAEVLMRTGSRQVMGTLSPGPASVPDRGEVTYRGRTYQAYSFSGVAFPEGPLRISLLL